MFNLLSNENKLRIINDKEVLMNNIDVALHLDDHQAVPLQLTDTKKKQGDNHLGSFVEKKCKFVDSNGNHETFLYFQIYDDFITVSVKSSLTLGKLFQDNPTFAVKHAISITFAEFPSEYSFMANYKHKDWWTRPAFGENVREVPDKTQSFLMKTKEVYYHLLPVADEHNRTELIGSSDGLKLTISPLQGGFTEILGMVMVMGKGKNPFQLVDANVQKGIALLEDATPHISQKSYPEILDYLGWCSWDAFYQEVNEEGLLRKAEELNRLDIPVKWIMIDDGWSTIKENKLMDLGADPDKFPSGLSYTVQQLKRRNQVNWVGVWHTIAGYWDGIHPDSVIAKKYKENLYTANRGANVPFPDVNKGFGFWNSWHQKLKQNGIDFVKVDSQSALANFLKHQIPIGIAAKGAHTALEASSSLHFNNTIINCMGMAQENIWNRPNSAVSRNSDDFVPYEEHSFREHALQNAYNSYYHAPFYYCDWDMYWSVNHDDKQNMILRAVSGGPIYISDELGKTNPKMVMPLVYQDGKIIRCDQPGLPTEDSLMIDPTKHLVPLKIWNKVRSTGVVAAFHINGDTVSIKGTVGPKDIHGIQGESFIIFDCLNWEYTTVKQNEHKHFNLEADDAAIFAVIPEEEKVTPIGLVNKLIPMDSIETFEKESFKLSLRLREGGEFAFISNEPVKKVQVDGVNVTWTQSKAQEELYIVDCNNDGSEIDIDIFL